MKEEPSEAASVGLNGRPKRQAAAKFSVPEKLMPRLRKTKALLKQGVAAPAAVSQKDAEKDPDDGLGEHGNAGRTSDSDDYDDKDDVDEDSATDPDYSLPKRQNAPRKLAVKFQAVENSAVRVQTQWRSVAPQTGSLLSNRKGIRVCYGAFSRTQNHPRNPNKSQKQSR